MQTCLIVDEAPVVRKVAARILLNFGLAVETVENYDDARAWIEANGYPNILMTAANATDAEGLDFVREIAAPAKAAGTVILASIVESNLGLMTRLRRAGAVDFILKPFDRSGLQRSFSPYLPMADAS